MTESEISFAKQQIDIEKHLQSMSPADEIEERCSMAGCNERQRSSHKSIFLKGKWNPHPSERFVRWWMNRGFTDVESFTLRAWSIFDDTTQSQRPIKATQAYNCEPVRECYRQFLAKQRQEMT